LTIDDLTATTVAGLDTSSGTGNEQIFTDGEGGLVAPGYVSELPVAYSNLVAWYPFDSARYTGSNADDVTGIIGGSGDDTAYDGTVDGATYQTSAGVTDINAGVNSGAFDFDGNDDAIPIPDINQISTNKFCTVACWINADSFGGEDVPLNQSSSQSDRVAIQISSDVSTIGISTFDGTSYGTGTTLPSTNSWHHCVGVVNGNAENTEFYLNGVDASGSHQYGGLDADSIIGSDGDDRNQGREFNGTIDDVRFYDRALTASEISSIYNNTEP
jgi:hypothetical protein